MERYEKLIKALYDIASPIIQYKIDKELYEKEYISINEYISLDDKYINYWLNVYDRKRIHSRLDSAYENSIAKLLDLGFTKVNKQIVELYSYLLDEKYWREEELFTRTIIQIVKYPFLIRAGYWDHRTIHGYFMKRLEIVERTIKKYGYQFEDKKASKIHQDDLIFKLENNESLPTIYDLYAFAFYPKNNVDITRRIENVIEYILDKRFQIIPKNAYRYDSIKKRYYAVGNVYHACITKERKLLMLYLLSHFKVSKKNSMVRNELESMLIYRLEDGFFEFDKNLLKEKKDSYYIYSGSHMGLGGKRINKNWRKLESTYWMLKILLNLDKNNI